MDNMTIVAELAVLSVGTVTFFFALYHNLWMGFGEKERKYIHSVGLINIEAFFVFVELVTNFLKYGKDEDNKRAMRIGLYMLVGHALLLLIYLSIIYNITTRG